MTLVTICRNVLSDWYYPCLWQGSTDQSGLSLPHQRFDHRRLHVAGFEAFGDAVWHTERRRGHLEHQYDQVTFALDGAVDWMKRQFTLERTVRWMDGANPKPMGGNRSFVQVLTYDHVRDGERYVTKSAPHLWWVCDLGVGGGARSCIYTKAYFFPLQGGGYRAEIEVCSVGVRYSIPGRILTSSVDFTPEENAPRKLNREIRRMRELLFQPAA